MRSWLIALRDRGAWLLGWLQLVHDEGDRHPLNRLLEHAAARFAMVLACAAALVLLERAGYTDLLAWTDRLFPRSRYPVLFAAFALVYLGLCLFGERGRKPLLLAASLAALAYFDLRFAAGSLAFLAAYYAVVFSSLRTAFKLGFLVASFAALVIAANVLWFPELHAQRPWIAAAAYGFAVNYTFRIVYFFHEARMRKYARVPLVEFLLYFVFAPYFIIVPYMLAIPRYGVFARSVGRRDPAREASGVRYLVAGVLLIVIYHHLSQLYSPRSELIAYLRADDLARATAVGVLYYPVEAVLSILGVAYVLTGMLRVFGADVAPPFQRALLSTSIHEWWRRWNVHFRDFLVDIFFYPLLVKWRKRNPYLTIVVGCASVFLVGSTLFHWLGKYYFEAGSHVNVYWGITVENTLMFVAVAIGLCLEKRRLVRAKDHPPAAPPRLDDREGSLGAWVAHAAGRAGKLAATYLFLLLVVVYAGYGATYAAYYEPVEDTAAPYARAIEALEAGDPARAGSLVADEVATLRRQVRALPREPVRRLRLALAYSVPGAWHDPAAARREVVRALPYVDRSDPEQARLLRQLWPAGLRESPVDRSPRGR